MRTGSGLEIPGTLGEWLHPKRCTLLIYDMQIGIIRQLPHGAEITEQVGRLLEVARTAGMRVVYTRHLSLSKEWMGTFQYRQAMAWQRADDPQKVQPWFLRGSPGFEVVPQLQPRDEDAVFDKLSMSAFEGTPLAMAMRDCGIDSFLIAGVATEIGIDVTCRHGTDLGFVPILVRDACGAGHADAGERAIATLEFLGDTVVTDLSSVRSYLRKSTI